MTTTTISANEANAIVAAAERVGGEYGRTQATWFDVDGPEHARFILDKLDDCYFDFPATPLAGEWGDDPTQEDILSEIVEAAHVRLDPSDLDDDFVPSVYDYFETGFYSGYEAVLVARCNYHLEP